MRCNECHASFIQVDAQAAEARASKMSRKSSKAKMRMSRFAMLYQLGILNSNMFWFSLVFLATAPMVF